MAECFKGIGLHSIAISHTSVFAMVHGATRKGRAALKDVMGAFDGHFEFLQAVHEAQMRSIVLLVDIYGCDAVEKPSERSIISRV